MMLSNPDSEKEIMPKKSESLIQIIDTTLLKCYLQVYFKHKIMYNPVHKFKKLTTTIKYYYFWWLQVSLCGQITHEFK